MSRYRTALSRGGTMSPRAEERASRALDWCLVLALVLACAWVVPAFSGERAPAPQAPPIPEFKRERELVVPFEDLSVLLESGPRRVLLSREEYDELEARARETEAARVPVGALLTSADYTLTVEQERAVFEGALEISVLEDGLHRLGLDMAGIGLQTARFGERNAAIGRADDGRPMLFVEGKGNRTLALRGVMRLETTAARQVLNFRLPCPTATRVRLTVPGDVEVRAGASVIHRVFDGDAEETRMEILVRPGDVSLVMSLNSRLKRKERVVMARSVVVDEFTQAYERLHATVSLDVLHRAVSDFRFAVPPGFDVTDVVSPALARWVILHEKQGDVLDVHLREATTGKVIISLSALKTGQAPARWTFPSFVPEDVVGHVAVVGLLLEDRLDARDVETRGLMPIDRSVLLQALPRTVLQADAGEAALRPLVAYYAPQAEFSLSATFTKAAAKLYVTTNLLLLMEDRGLSVRGGFAVTPREEKRFHMDFLAPPGWDVTDVTGEGGDSLVFERYRSDEGGARVHVRLPGGLPEGQESSVYFSARHVPRGWYDAWQTTTLDVPVFAVKGAARDVGAIAVDAMDDMEARPVALTRLSPLDENEKASYGLSGVGASLAYRYDGQPYAARLTVERIAPRLTAESYAFFRVERDMVAVHYEIVYGVEQARTRRVALVLPPHTSTALSIRGLNGTMVKEYAATVTDEGHLWTALLSEARRDTVHLAVDFQLPVTEEGLAQLDLPMVRASGVAYQSGLVAVEGNAELDIRIVEHPRKVDIGELADAEYQPGRRLLGAFGFVGSPPPLCLAVAQRRAYPLPPAIVQRAELVTLVSASGTSQSSVRFLLQSKTPYVEIVLPQGSDLWAAAVDGKPAKPQQEGNSVLLALPSDAGVRDVQVTYETPVGGLAFWDRLALPAPRLVLHEAEGDDGRDVPVADLRWELHVPNGFRVISSSGTVVSDAVKPTPPAAVSVARWLYRVAGGINLRRGMIGGCMSPLGSAMQRTRSRASMGAEYDFSVDMEDVETMAMPSVAPAASRPQRGDAMARYRIASPQEGETEESGRDELKEVQSALPKAKAEATYGWALEGARSLKIALVRSRRALVFQSLGVEPRLALVVAHERRLEALSWVAALVTLLAGLVLTTSPFRRKATFVIAVLLTTTVLPAAPGLLGLALVLNGAFYAACVLIPLYLVAGLCLGGVRRVASWLLRLVASGATMALVAAVSGLVLGSGPAHAADDGGAEAEGARYVVEMVPPTPVKVPEDAVLVLGDGEASAGDRVLVPYDRFLELWRLAHPDEAQGVGAAAAYATAGAEFSAELGDGEFLLVEGALDVELFTDEHVEIPLALAGGVLTRADLDGEPARLASVTPLPGAQGDTPRKGQRDGATAPPLTVLHARGKGVHRLTLAVRVKLERRGGWRVARAHLPAAPAARLRLRVPEAGTEVVVGDVADRSAYSDASAGTWIDTALGREGVVNVQWRPRVSEGEVDRALTADSSALLDVQEDHVRLVWALTLAFRRGEHEFFTLDLPRGYLVEKVVGSNVRGWQVEAVGRKGQGGNGRVDPAMERRLRIGLLKRTREREAFTLHLWRPGPVPAGGEEEIAMPSIGVSGAIRHTGRFTVRRSPALDVRTARAEGVRRTDLASAEDVARIDDRADESPLGILPYQTYAFVSVPFDARIAVKALKTEASASLQTVLRLAERERALESRVTLTVQHRPVHRARLVLPAGAEVDGVVAPGVYEWAAVAAEDRTVVTVYFAAGLQGSVSIVVRARLAGAEEGTECALPRIEVLDVARQTGYLVVQADPAFDVEARELEGIESVLLDRTHGWLQKQQRALARLALYHGAPDYAGRLVLVPRRPDVVSYTVSNIRVTDRAIEETVLIDFTIRNAGVQTLTFDLPAHLADARISVPLLRQKTITPVEDRDLVRVAIELQDEVMHQVRVLVESDRLLSPGLHVVRLPEVGTGRMDRRYIGLESAGRDEVVLSELAGLDVLSRQQKEWARVAAILSGASMQAFIATPGVAEPRLVFESRQRATVETAGARIGLAQTLVMTDAGGAYRASQTYHVDNQTEQFLDILLPAGAAVWTARVAGEFVKPVIPDVSDAGRVRIPLVKTAAGDLDYAVVLKYGGRMTDLAHVRDVSFPLIRTSNINVELSQVELLLPRTHQWWLFDGTMRRIKQEGDFEAGVLSYRNKLAKRLVRTLEFGNPFEKARAASNLKGLKKSLETYQRKAQVDARNESLNLELSNTATILGDADKQLVEIERTVEVARDDNRLRMNSAFDEQANAFSRNVVVKNGANWDDAGIQAWPAPTSGLAFNGRWLAGNRLEREGGREAGDLGRLQVTGKPVSQVVQLGMQAAQNEAQVFFNVQPPAAPAQQQMQQRANVDVQVQDGRTEERAKSRRSQRKLAERYQNKLEQQAAVGTGDTTVGGLQSDVNQRMLGVADDESGMDGDGGGGVPGVYRGVGEMASGLASLAVELPPRDMGRWASYRFTTPRGEIEVTAWAVSRKIVDAAGRVALAAVALLLVLAWRRFLVGQARWRWRSKPVTTGMMLLSILGLMAGLFPAASALLLVVAIVLKIAGRRLRRRADDQVYCR